VWTQSDLTEAAGVALITVSRIENHRHEERSRQSSIRRLTAAFDVDLTWSVVGDEDSLSKRAA